MNKFILDLSILSPSGTTEVKIFWFGCKIYKIAVLPPAHFLKGHFGEFDIEKVITMLWPHNGSFANVKKSVFGKNEGKTMVKQKIHLFHEWVT